MKYRTHTCGELTGKDIDKEVVLSGWVARVRDLGGLLFFDMRDRYGKTQVVTDQDSPLAKKVLDLHMEDVIRVTCKVRSRPDGMRNESMITGEIEIDLASIKWLSKSASLPILVEDEEEPGEELRLRYRYLDLRRKRMQHNIMLRHKALQSVRNYHDEIGFYEIETPTLIRSTPEGARDFVVPSRIHQGKCYALPQSPQLYKQTLMIGGFDRYYQIVRCFRDEDLRSDRQPEFTQIDLEMSFVTEEDIFRHTEGMMTRLVKDVLDREVLHGFPQITYENAIQQYGSDAPDLRYDLRIKQVNELFYVSGFKAFDSVVTKGGSVLGIRAEGKGSLSRKQRDELEKLGRAEGLAGLLQLPVTEANFTGIIGKLFSDERQTKLKETFDAEPGDLIMMAAGDTDETLDILGRLRRLLAKRWDLVDPDELRFCWVINPPMFEKLPDSDVLTAVHHPFTSPFPEDEELLQTNPLKVRSRAYDLVLNGVELGSGSIRIHDPKLQERVFDAIGIDKEEAHRRFGFLLEALKYGTPPHGGIALGFDRIIMLLAGGNSIKDMIAFPKTNTAASLMDGAPTEIDDLQWSELGLSVKTKK